jgi:hypothetical protein
LTVIGTRKNKDHIQAEDEGQVLTTSIGKEKILSFEFPKLLRS